MRARNLIGLGIIVVLGALLFPLFHRAVPDRRPTATSARSLAFSQIDDWIRDGASSVDDIIERLPPSYKNGGFALMFHSRSLQHASKTHPRMILYGEDAKLILAFNGDPSLQGYNDLEAIEFNDSTRAFAFYERSFSPVPKKETAPESCRKCHSIGIRDNLPIWDPYALWPGAYGDFDNRLDLVNGEAAALLEFATAAGQSRRYRNFPLIQEWAKLSEDELQSRFPRTNARLSTLIGGLIQASFLERLRKSPNFPAFQYALLQMTALCRGPLYPERAGTLIQAGISKHAAAQKNPQDRAIHSLVERLIETESAERFSLKYGPASLREFLELMRGPPGGLSYFAGALGVTDPGWVATQDRQSYLYLMPIHFYLEFERQIFELVSRSDGELGKSRKATYSRSPDNDEWGPFDVHADDPVYCQALRERAVKAIDDWLDHSNGLAVLERLAPGKGKRK